MSILERLNQIAKEIWACQAPPVCANRSLIFKILQTQAEKADSFSRRACLECLPDGFGFLTRPGIQLSAGPRRRLRFAIADSALRSYALATQFRARSVRPKRASATSHLIKVDAINFEPPEESRNKIFFDNLTPLYPDERLKLETGSR